MRLAAPARSFCVAALLLMAAASCALGLQPSAAKAQDGPLPSEPSFSLSANVGIGWMRGGHAGGLMSAQAAPIALDVQVLTVRPPRLLLGGVLRLELADAKAVAGIFRVQLRHPFGPLELRPGLGVPIYLAPRTMIGPEATLGIKFGFSKDLGVLVTFDAQGFIFGSDVPKGSTVVMLHAFLGVELFI